MNEKHKNNNGFSMVELLAAIAILGLLSTIAIVGINTILNKAEKNHYETQREKMILAAQSYAQENRNILPKEVGDTHVITLNELQTRKYIGEVVDRSKNQCDNAESTVVIFKYSKIDYSYRTYLKCGDSTYGDPIDNLSGPKVNLTLDSTYKNAKFTYSIEKQNDEDEDKIISYSYQIYNYGSLLYDSGSVSVSKTDRIEEKKVSLKKYLPGKITVVFKAANLYY